MGKQNAQRMRAARGRRYRTPRPATLRVVQMEKDAASEGVEVHVFNMARRTRRRSNPHRRAWRRA